MLTPSFSLTATERVLPRLALDFTTGVLDPRVTVTRALNTATRVNSSGVIETVNADLPRFDYNPVTLAPRGLLIEEARANLMLYSQNFADVIWTKGAGASVSQNVVGPDNLSNSAATLTALSGSGAHWLYQLFAGSAAPYTHSVYAKAGTASWLGVSFGGGADADGAFFNLANGTIGTVAFGSTATITNAGNGWYMCTITRTLAAANYFGALAIHTANNQSLTWSANGTETIFIYGDQVEAGAFATSYIPTTTTSLTRNADVVTMTGTNFSDWYNASEGALSFEGSILADQGATTVDFSQISNGVSNSNIISLCMFGATATLFQVVNGTTQANIDLGTLAVGSVFKMTGAYKLDSFAGAINGGAAVTDVSGSIPTGMTQIGLGNRLGGGYMNGHARRFMYWPQRLTNAEIQAFSK